MIGKPPITLGDDTSADWSIYDPDPETDAGLWFLPGPDDEDDDDPTAPPLPKANQRPLVDLAEWVAAEATLAGPLAQVSTRIGALDERLRRAPAGWRQRLALMEAAALSWLALDRISVERLSLWHALRLSGVQDDHQALAHAGWAVRRLSGGVLPHVTSADDISQFLGRQDPSGGAQTMISGQTDERVSDQIANWCDLMGQAQVLHPISRAAFGLHLWGPVGLTDRSVGAALEAAVLAARSAVAAQTGGALFLPLALSGIAGLRSGGVPTDRLQRFYQGAGSATLAALRHLDQLETWQARAEIALAHRSGRTPKRLIGLLCSWPMVSAPMAEAETGISRAAIQRNLNSMAETGLIREITGQGRYRVWAAKI